MNAPRRFGLPHAMTPRLWRYVAALALTGIFGLLPAAPAAAHPFLVRTVPRANERLSAGPEAITLQFSEPIVGGERVALLTIDGQTVPVSPPGRLPGGAGFAVALPPLGAAVYLVSWQGLGRDGDLAAGEFAFAVGSAPALPTASAAGAAVAWPNVVASWLFLGGLTLALGGLASEAVVWGPLARRHGLVVPGAPVGPSLLLSLLGAALVLALIAAAGAGGGLAAGLDPRTWAAALGTRPGLLATLSAGLVAYALWLVALPRLRRWALLPLAGAVAAAAWRGHSGVSAEAGLWWAAPANALHLAAAGLWLGALAHLALVVWQRRSGGQEPLLGEAARRYAGLALLVVPPLLVAGLATALAEVTAPAELLATPYGRVLLLKLLLVLAALALALAARRRALRPALARKLRPLRRLVAVEALTLAGVVGATAALVNLPTPRATVAEAGSFGPPPLSGPVVRTAALAGQFAVHLAAADGQLELRAIPPSEQLAPGTRVELAGRSPTGAQLSLYPRACGPGCLTMGFAWPEGTSRFSATVWAPDRPGGAVELELPWPPGSEASALLGRVIETMRAQPAVRFTERVSSGPGAEAGPYPIAMSGAYFIERELYVASGADDVRLVPGDAETRSIVLFLPSSWIWYQLWIDADDRLRREPIVNPGHRIERTFSYGPEAPG